MSSELENINMAWFKTMNTALLRERGRQEEGGFALFRHSGRAHLNSISQYGAYCLGNIDCKTFTTQTFTTPDIHHPRRSPPQTFTTSDVHHPRRSPPQTFTTSDIHHPQCKIRRSPPQTFTTPDVHHLRRSPPQTFTTPFVKSDVHHPRHSPPQTFTTPYSKMLHSPPTNIHHQPTSPSPTMITPKRKIRQPCTRAVECSCYLQVIELFLIIFV